MSTWYTAYYGNWRRGNVVTRVGCSYSRKEIINMAQRGADETGEVVTILAETGTKLDSFQVSPKREVDQ